jgi:hypothetical protein
MPHSPHAALEEIKRYAKDRSPHRRSHYRYHSDTPIRLDAAPSRTVWTQGSGSRISGLRVMGTSFLVVFLLLAHRLVT